MTYLPENVFVEIYTEVDGLPTWTNIGGDIESPITVNTGFSETDQLSRLAPGGDMRFDLDNSASAYDPSPSFYKGQKIRLRVKFGSFNKVKFFGYIDHIGLDVGTWGAQQAHVVCIDWLSLAAITPIRALAGMTNTTIDLAVAALLAQMQIQPEEIDFEIGNIVLPSVFDQITPSSTVYSELQNLVMGEWGYVYMKDGGQTLKIENSLSRTGDGSDYKTTNFYLNDGVAEDFMLLDGTNFLLLDGTNFLLEGEPTAASFDSNFGETYTNLDINHGDQMVNQIFASAVPVVIGGSTAVLYPFDIATGSSAIFVPSNNNGNPYILQGQYKDPTAGGAQISGSSVVTPVVSTDWRFNSKADGTGTDLSANIKMTFTPGQSGFRAIIINSGTPGYITKFNVRGVPIYRYSPVETLFSDERSVWDYGDYSLQFTRQYGQSSDDIQPFAFRLLMRDRKPRTIFSNPKFNGFDTLNHLAGFLALDIGDQIRLASTKPESDSLYYIQGTRFTIQPGSEAITCDYITAETLAGAVAGVTEIAVDQTSANQGVRFVYIPSVCNLNQRTITARIYLDGATIASHAITGIYGELFYVTPYLGSYKLVFERNFSTTPGQWKQNTGSITQGAWCNVAVTYEQTSTGNDPTIYLNGSVVANTETITPSGTPSLEDGEYLNVGNYRDFVIPGIGFTGKVEDVAYYNRILTPTEISTIHNSGTRLPFASYPMNGLKFFFGGMDDDSYTAKLNAALTSLDTVYDLVNGFTGQPMNNPTLRATG